MAICPVCSMPKKDCFCTASDYEDSQFSSEEELNFDDDADDFPEVEDRGKEDPTNISYW